MDPLGRRGKAHTRKLASEFPRDLTRKCLLGLVLVHRSHRRIALMALRSLFLGKAAFVAVVIGRR